MKENQTNYLKGRGAQKNTHNPFHKNHYELDDQSLAEELSQSPNTQLFFERPKKIISQNSSPDLPWHHSINPYQGCEHGCIYCYARNTHEYWGFSAGLDFESKIIVKKNAPSLLEKQFQRRKWKPVPIMLSGATDPYQPIEKDLGLSRKILHVIAKYRNPVSIYTKNSLILRDLDILQDLAKDQLVHVYLSITTLDENTRRILEPRTASSQKKLETLHQIAQAGVPIGIMLSPIIPGINNYEIPNILKTTSEYGAQDAKYTVVRLNGSIAELFRDWLNKNFPDRAEKVWNQIKSLHGGQVSDRDWGRRMIGQGQIAESIAQLFKISKKRYFKDRSLVPYNFHKFRPNGNPSLFD